MYYKIIYIWYK